MLVSIKAKLAYLAMPKTGSTSVEKALGPHCDLKFHKSPTVKHTNLRKYRRFIQPYLKAMGIEGVTTVCVVREPVGWLRSWHAYRQRDALDGHPNSTKDVGFADFVAAYLSDEPPAWARVGRQSDFVADRTGAPGVDRMFRHDDMEGFAAFLGRRTKSAIEFPRLNVSPRAEAELPAALRARLEAERPEDFALYESLSSRAAA